MSRKFLLLFILLNVALTCFYLDTWKNDNTTSRVLTVQSLSETHSLIIDKYADRTGDKCVINGHFYSDKAPLPALLVTAVYYPLLKCGILHTGDNFQDATFPIYKLGDILCGALPFVLIIFLTIRYASMIDRSSRTVIISMLVFYGSFIFIYSGSFFSHILSAAFLLCAYIALKFPKKYFICGLLAGAAFACEYTIGIVFLLWPLQVWIQERSLKNASLILLGTLPMIALVFFVNYSITGSFTDLPYNHEANPDFAAVKKVLGFSYPSLIAIFHLTISPFRGLAFYMPMLLLLIGLLVKYRNVLRDKLSARNFLLPLAFIYVIIVSAHHIWWGGWCWGPRHLIPLAVLLGFETVRMLAKFPVNKWILWSLGGISIFIAWMCKSTIMYSIPTEVNDPFGEVFAHFQKGEFNGDNFLSIRMGTSPAFAAICWLVLFISAIAIVHFTYKKEDSKII